MRALISCESSGKVREAMRAAGVDAWSNDLLPADDGSPYHIQGDAIEVSRRPGWDLMIAHPPCTFLCGSGLHWNKRRPERAQKTADAYEFFMALWNAPIARICIENPIGCMSTLFRKPDQIIQPWQFGDDASKATCLWLSGLNPLVIDRSKIVTGRVVGIDKRGMTIVRWANQTDSGQNKLGPSADRWKLRSMTYPGIAQAMAEQWGNP